ncbi:phosphotransferase [Glaciecola petra]|uniref:Phosphotransferase n=1 Tax=Glaciecola petra TaxID=3075602 RepID=A0ABU2ZN93_9ALTE|nr:phosphotransferase [Aestuariibacter sp. P117]MDT0593886.1 phosphotransferase [Aestuariibacter sp. P117]
MKTNISLGSKVFKQILHQLRLHDVIECKTNEVETTLLNSGALNQAFKLKTTQKTILLKVFSDIESVPVDRTGIFKLQEELAILGLAPKPIYLSQNKRIYCEEWLSRAHTGSNKLDLSNKIDMLAESLHNIHSSFVSVPVLPLLQHWEVYWQQIDSPSDDLCAQYKQMKLTWQDLLKHHESDFVLCHNDLHLDHVVSPQGPFYDWEYAAKGCRYFDIANCASINDFDDKTLIELCHSYAHLSNLKASQVEQNVFRVKDVVAFTNYLWHQSLGIE